MITINIVQIIKVLMVKIIKNSNNNTNDDDDDTDADDDDKILIVTTSNLKAPLIQFNWKVRQIFLASVCSIFQTNWPTVLFLLQEGPAFVKKIKGVFCFKLSGGPNGEEGLWIVDVKNGSGAVKFGSNGEISRITFE